MKKYLIRGLVLLLSFAGFYFKIFKIDPAFIVIGLALIGMLTYIIFQINALAVVVKKSHEVSAANQRELARKLDTVRYEIRKNNQST